MKTLSVTSKVSPNCPGTRLSPPDSEMYSAGAGKPSFSGPLPSPLRMKVFRRISAL